MPEKLLHHRPLHITLRVCYEHLVQLIELRVIGEAVHEEVIMLSYWEHINGKEPPLDVSRSRILFFRLPRTLVSCLLFSPLAATAVV
jgi:hypothetical protein